MRPGFDSRWGLFLIFFFVIMSSSLATNAVLPGLSPLFPLLGTKEGHPLNKQIPKTIQTYSGAGGVSIVPDGSDILFISGTMAGALVIDLTSTANYTNMIGRSLTVIATDDHVGTITLDITGGGRSFLSSVALETGDQALVATTVPTVFTVYFVDALFAAIHHGDTVTIA